MKERKQRFLSVHDVAVLVAWHHGMHVTDEEAYDSLLRMRKFVEYALSILENEPSAFDGGDEKK